MTSTHTDTTTVTSLALEEVNFQYPGAEKPALSDIGLRIEPGTISTLVGPSGCGKSTLLKTVGGMILPDSGRVVIGEQDVTNTPMTKRKIGWVPQQYALFEHMDVKSNVAFGLRAQKYPKPQRIERVREVLELCHMAEFADRAVDELSGGQRQRVAIARALAPYPRLLLLDEPLAALDPQLRGQLRADLRTMIRQAGVTTIMVTHDQEEALAMADHIVVMNNGRIVQSGRPNEVWAQPNSSWIASFLGHATVVPVANRLTDGRSEILPGLEVPTTGGSKSNIAVRALDFYAVDAGTADGIEGRVVDCEYHGDNYAVSVAVPHPQQNSFTLPAQSAVVREVNETVTLCASNRRNIPEVD